MRNRCREEFGRAARVNVFAGKYSGEDTGEVD
jgi:hypothetical protein